MAPCVCTQKSLYMLPSDVFASILADVTKQSPSMKGMKTRSSHGTEMAFTWRSCATGWRHMIEDRIPEKRGKRNKDFQRTGDLQSHPASPAPTSVSGFSKFSQEAGRARKHGLGHRTWVRARRWDGLSRGRSHVFLLGPVIHSHPRSLRRHPAPLSGTRPPEAANPLSKLGRTSLSARSPSSSRSSPHTHTQLPSVDSGRPKLCPDRNSRPAPPGAPELCAAPDTKAGTEPRARTPASTLGAATHPIQAAASAPGPAGRSSRRFPRKARLPGSLPAQLPALGPSSSSFSSFSSSSSRRGVSGRSAPGLRRQGGGNGSTTTWPPGAGPRPGSRGLQEGGASHSHPARPQIPGVR
ncbi:uncharacterized protein LOC116083845 [Mastomys coucha]|uniref:uncharacterized protein LOC116083845 n=1 Tax=Mastomys coucha TaxID=35658 RepID=UPI00126289AF|nr:uncharacterized protein LOC116083845 [Mastomys coucha]